MGKKQDSSMLVGGRLGGLTLVSGLLLTVMGCEAEPEFDSIERALALEGECEAVSDCQSSYPGLDVAACNPTNGVCRCWDPPGSNTKVRCGDLEPSDAEPVRLLNRSSGQWLQAQGVADGSSSAGCGGNSATNVRGTGVGATGDFTKWILEPAGDAFHIVSVGNDRLLAMADEPDPTNASHRVARLVDRQLCAGDASTRWRTVAAGAEYVYLDNVAYDYRLQLSSAVDVDSGSGLQLRAVPTSKQGNLVQWSLPPADGGGGGGGGGSVHRYAHAPNPGAYPDGLDKSTRYRVMVKLASDGSGWNAGTHSTAVYDAWPDYDHVPGDLVNNHVHIAQFDTTARVRVRVEVLQGSLDSVVLKPQRYGMQATQQTGNDWVEFELDPSDLTRHVLVELNDPEGSKLLDHGLMIFSNPPAQIPAGNVMVLPSGVVNESSPFVDSHDRIYIPPNSPYDAIYIPEDTIVDGRIHVDKVGFTVAGRGMVVGSRWEWAKSDPNWTNHYPITPDGERVKGLVESDKADTVFDGVMTVHPYHFNFVGGDLTQNVKAFGWRHSSDGIHGVDIVRGVFTRVNDDHIYFPSRVIEDSTFWGLTNGSIFQGGWGGPGSNGGSRQGGHARRCNVVRGEWNGDGGARQNNGIFGSVDLSDSDVSDFDFTDIIVEGKQCRMLNFAMACSGGCNSGVWKDITFKDISFEHALECPNGGSLDNFFATDGSLQTIRFENVRIDSQLVDGWNDLEPLQKKNVSGVVFAP